MSKLPGVIPKFIVEIRGVGRWLNRLDYQKNIKLPDHFTSSVILLAELVISHRYMQLVLRGRNIFVLRGHQPKRLETTALSYPSGTRWTEWSL